MTPADLARLIAMGAFAAWEDLRAQHRERGGDGKLRDTAISITRRRTVITVHCDYSNEARTLSAAFRLPEPLPEDDPEFILRLHEWLEQQEAGRETLH
jgi:hypothetical protein